MVGRYMVICSEHLGSLPEQSRQIMAVASASLDLQPIFEQADIVVLTDSKQSYVTLSRSTGIVLGDLFARHNERRLDALADADSEALVRSAGASLMAHYWGAYVAIVCDRPELGPHILRAPSGDVPCYQTNFGGLRLFFSHLDIIDALGLVNAAVDFEAVAQMLSCQVARSTRTCLLGVQELLPGTRTSRSRGAWPSETIWTPWTFAAPDRQIARRADAVDEMRETALSCARSWASTCSSPLLELSGGLDSSIVGACMAAAGAVGPCVTMVTPDPVADERRYAAAVAARIGAPLMAVPLQVADVDIANLTKLRYPRPVGHFLSRIADDLFERASHDLGADSFFGGSGGDYILCYLGTSAPVADVFLAKGFGTEFLRACSNLAALHRSTIWKVARLAYAKARSADRLQPKLSASFLNPDAGSVVVEDVVHGPITFDSGELDDLIIARAGASTVTEIAAVGAAALFVPFPAAVDDHQTANARFLVDAGAAWLEPQAGLAPQKLATLLQGMHREQLLAMATRARGQQKTEAVHAVVNACIELAKVRNA